MLRDILMSRIKIFVIGQETPRRPNLLKGFDALGHAQVMRKQADLRWKHRREQVEPPATAQLRNDYNSIRRAIGLDCEGAAF